MPRVFSLSFRAPDSMAMAEIEAIAMRPLLLRGPRLVSRPVKVTAMEKVRHTFLALQHAGVFIRVVVVVVPGDGLFVAAFRVTNGLVVNVHCKGWCSKKYDIVRSDDF